MSDAQQVMKTERMPAALAASSPAWLSSNTSGVGGIDAERARREQETLRIGLGVADGVAADARAGSMQSSTPSLSRKESITERGLEETTPSFRLRAAAARTASGAPGIGFTSVATSFQCASRSAAITRHGAINIRACPDDVGDIDPGAALGIRVRKPEVRESILRKGRADRLIRVDLAVDQRAVEVEEHRTHWRTPVT